MSNQIDYKLIRTVHRVDAILNNEETHRRLREVSSNIYHDARCKAVAKVLEKKSGMSKTDLEVLNSFPAHGINIGMYSNALIFAPALHCLTLTCHKAIVSLMKQGALAIVEGYRIDLAMHDRMEQIIVRV